MKVEPVRSFRALSAVMRMALGIALFVFGGYALDRVLGTSPWLLLAGTVVGAVAAVVDMVVRAGGNDASR